MMLQIFSCYYLFLELSFIRTFYTNNPKNLKLIKDISYFINILINFVFFDLFSNDCFIHILYFYFVVYLHFLRHIYKKYFQFY